MKPTPKPAPAKVSPFRQPAVLVPLLLAVVAAGYFVFQWLQGRSERAELRAQLLQDVQTAASKRPVETDELSRLMAKLTKFDDFETDRDLLAAQARIELARGRVDRAFEMFAPIASQPGATPAEQRLAASLGLRRHQQGLPDRATAAGALAQVLQFADTAYRDGQDPADLTVAWLAAMRLADTARADALAGQLLANHAASPGAKLVQMLREFREDRPRRELDELRAEFDDAPGEIDAMTSLVVLQSGDLTGALSVAEGALLRASGLLAVRWAAALVFHARALGESEPARAQWLARRDAQLDWLAERAPEDDDRRPRWASMRAVR